MLNTSSFKKIGEIDYMDRETVIQNIINNYGEYGITREIVESLIDDGEAEGFSYDLIYLNLKAELCHLAGEEFYCTSEDLARALGMSIDEVDQLIEESKEELIEAGENPDEYFQTVYATGFMVN